MRATIAGAGACVLVLGGCDQAREFLVRAEPAVPTADQVRPYYDAHASVLDVTVSGNVVEVRVRQPFDQVDRGGALWARVGPYVNLMSPATRQLFEDYPGVAAVRVVTLLPGDDEVARALLRRDALNEVRWRRTLNILGHALRDGQESPRRLEELTDWGERYTEFRYNPDYVRR